MTNSWLAVHAHLLPRARPQARFVRAVPAFGDQALEALGLYGGNQVREVGLERGDVPDRLGELGQHLPFEQAQPDLQRFVN